MIAVVAAAAPTFGMLAATVEIMATPKTPPNHVYHGACSNFPKLPLPISGSKPTTISVPVICTKKAASHKPASFPKAEFKVPCSAIRAPAKAAVKSAANLPVKTQTSCTASIDRIHLYSVHTIWPLICRKGFHLFPRNMPVEFRSFDGK
jgi:hypothetical protein